MKNEEKVLARIRAKVRELYGDNFKFEEILVCRRCMRRGTVKGYVVKELRKKTRYFSLGKEPLSGMGQETLIKERAKRVKVDIEIKDDKIVIANTPLKFISGICMYCYEEIREEVLSKATERALKILEQVVEPLPPFEAYKLRGKFIIQLPGKRYVIKTREELEELIRSKIRNILSQFIEKGKLSLDALIHEFRSKIDAGDWEILDLLILLKNLPMVKMEKRVKNFNDVVALVAYVEKESICNLKQDLKKYGMILTRDKTMGFAQKEIFQADEEVIVRKRGDILVSSNIGWRINMLYFKYLNPIKFRKTKENILQVKTKYAYVYIAPTQIE